eukprot:CAMPEP_0194209920 /NCGR_PEP_ID=MMETSP0156-20130528/7881_1 /TAXON_ID=33649 /ORGANISM="Thalassionema nitzschioides, Strain L26-B" /LENGTH=325 /DNA_ID=CAMNT_0038937179 /DNA_START=152 /DNA_END=1126 /DNA_ORIENTATION=-
MTEDDCAVTPCSSESSFQLKRHATRDQIVALPKEFRHFLAGGVAGMIAKSIVAPVDRIKILYQVSSQKFHIFDVPRVAGNILKGEGFQALWKGNTATLIRVFPYSGIQFMLFSRLKTWFLNKHAAENEIRKATGRSKREWGLSPTESLISGSIAGICSVLATYPLDMARAQLAVLRNKKDQRNSGLSTILVKNYKERGFKGLYRGITPTILGILPYAGIAFTLNEQSKRYIQNMTGRETTTIEKMQCGAISGLFAQSLTYPLEVTRRRMQTMGVVGCEDAALEALGLGKSKHNKVSAQVSMISILKSVYSEQGIAGLFKGVSLNW